MNGSCTSFVSNIIPFVTKRAVHANHVERVDLASQPFSTSTTFTSTRKRIARCCANEQSATPPPNEDWRAFRARLVRIERAETSKSTTHSQQEQEQSEQSHAPDIDDDTNKDKCSDDETLWAHHISHIEAGSLLLASPVHFKGDHACTFFANTAILILEHSAEGTIGVIINRPISVQVQNSARPQSDNNDNDHSNVLGTNAQSDKQQPFKVPSIPPSAMPYTRVSQPPSSSTASNANSVANNDLFTMEDPPIFLGGPVGLETIAVLHGDPSFGNHVAGALRSGPFTLAFERFRSGNLQHARFFFGYSGWRRGQLEQEIKDGVWFICSCCDQLILQKWEGGPQLHRVVLSLMGGKFAELAVNMGSENQE